jgi:hypothetical protein
VALIFESAQGRARRFFWHTVMSSKWAWICIALCGLDGVAVGIYLAWGHGRGGTIALTVLSAAGGLVLALILIFCGLWFSAPTEITREHLATLKEQVGTIDERLGGLTQEIAHTSDAATLRVALIAVRSELATCAIRIGEALDGARWWHTQQELPGSEWTNRVADLANPSVTPELHQKMERAYQKCGALNLRIRRYLIEHREGQQPMIAALTTIPASAYRFRDGDREALIEARRTIGVANAAISARVDGDQA